MDRPVRVLFVTYGGGHVEIVLRLAPLLRADPRFETRILGLTTAGPPLAAAGLPFQRVKDYLPLSGYEDALRLGAELSTGIHQESSGIPFDETCAYLGVSMTDLEAAVGRDRARELYRREGRAAFCPDGFLDRVLDRERPDVVVTTCHTRMERAATRTASRRGLRTVLIEDLLGYSTLGQRPAESRTLEIPREEWPGQVLVMNRWVRDRILSAGFPAERVVVTGQPVFSAWPEELSGLALDRSFRELEAGGHPILTYASPARRDILYDQSPHILALADRHPRGTLVVKLHPSVPADEFRSRFPRLPGNARLLWREDIRQVIRISDLLVTFRSTVGLLAALAGKPLITLDCTGEPDQVPYVSEGIATGVHRYEDLPGAVEAALGHPRRPPPEGGAFENPPGAAARVLEVLAGRSP